MKRSVAVIGLALASVIGFFGLNQLNQPKGFDPADIPDAVEYLAGVPKDTVVATVDGADITAEEYLYWAGYTAEMMEYYSEGELDWAAQSGDMVMLDYVKNAALETCRLYQIVETKAVELNCGMTEENEKAYQAGYDSTVAQLGGEKEMRKWLLQVGLSEEGFKKVNVPAYLYENILNSLMDTAPATAEEMADYIAENDVLRAKHILLMTMDPNTRVELTQEQKAAKKVQAEDILKQLTESGEPLELFDRLMAEYSEDTGLATNPDGYTFGPDQMVAEFEQGTRDLEYNEISGIIESAYGYHIILRLDPADEALAADLGQLLGESEAQEKLDAMVSDWMANAEVVTTEAYDQLDVPAYYSSLKALREEIAAADAEAAGEQ